MIDVLGALMGIDMQGFSRPEGSDEAPPGMPTSAASPPSSPPPSARPPPSSAASSSKVHEDVKMAEAEEDEDAAVRKKAEAEKKLGADAYKKRDFATAITHFTKAWDTWPKDIAFLTNLAGEAVLVLFGDAVTNVRVGLIFAQRRTLSKVNMTSPLKHVKRR
jgi:stress-induced-phosphoprotein 1